MSTANNVELSAGLNTGEIVECIVEQIMPYGAFVRITTNGRKGMIHISELSYNFVKDINEVLKIQDKVQAKIMLLSLPMVIPSRAAGQTCTRRARKF